MIPASLRAARIAAGLTQAATCRMIEDAAGLPAGTLEPRTLRRWESGERTPDFGPACLLAFLRTLSAPHATIEPVDHHQESQPL